MEIKKGYKGTDGLMSCRDVKYEVGKTYFVSDDKTIKETTVEAPCVSYDEDLKLCSTDVLHYCDELGQVFNHYVLDGKNRFFEIEILGKYKDTNDNIKSGTTRLKFARELSEQEIQDCLLEEQRKRFEKSSNVLTRLKEIQEKFPCLMIGGSLSLYLRGYNLKRFSSNWAGDFDFVSPYWIDLASIGGICQAEDEKNSGNDFDDTFSVEVVRGEGFAAEQVKADLCVSPESRYEIITYKGIEYKVNTLIDVIEAKARYAKQKGGRKHLEDLKELLSNNKGNYENKN